MALATQCPHCYTSFRVANDQLKLYAGIVRCGTCKQTFNGIEHLIAPGSAPRVPPPVVTSPEVKPAPATVAETSTHTEHAPTAHHELDQNDVDDLGENLRALLEEIKISQLEQELVDEATSPNSSTNETSHASATSSKIESTLGEESAHLSRSALSELDFEIPDDTPRFDIDPPSSQPLDDVEIKDLRSLENAIESELHRYEESDSVADEVPPEVDTGEPLQHEAAAAEPKPASEPLSDDHDLPDSAKPSMKIDDFVANTEEETPSDDEQEDDAAPRFVLEGQKKQRYRKWKIAGLVLASLLLLSTAALEAAYVFRIPIAAHFPQTKPHLLQLCALAKCTIPLPAQRSQLEISGSELQMLTKDPLINELTFQLQNKGTSPQAWPHLELTLKDARGKTVLQKVFSPKVYLGSDKQIAIGILPNSENTQKLFFELNMSKASDYSLDVFYP